MYVPQNFWLFLWVFCGNAINTLQISREFTICSGPIVSLIFSFLTGMNTICRVSIPGCSWEIYPIYLLLRMKIKPKAYHWPLSGNKGKTPWKIPQLQHLPSDNSQMTVLTLPQSLPGNISLLLLLLHHSSTSIVWKQMTSFYL